MKGIKRIHLISLIMVATAVALLVSASKDMSTYATFSDAAVHGKVVKVVGTLVKEQELYFDPAKDPNYFSFYMQDADGEQMQVILNSAKPQDFEMSEQVVVTGKVASDRFLASDILLKCPSKYKDEELTLRSDLES